MVSEQPVLENIVNYVAIVTALLFLQVMAFAFHVGQMRGKHAVKAPSVDGPDEFLRSFRVHQNTLEQLPVVVASMWMFAYLLSPTIAAAIGVVFFVSRLIYRSAYLKDPASRGLGFGLGFLCTLALVLGSLGGAIWKLL